MSFKEFYKKNKRWFGIFWVVIVIILYLTWLYLNGQNVDEEDSRTVKDFNYNYEQSEESSVIKFEYPDVWLESTTDYSTEGHDYEVSNLFSEDELFDVTISYEYISDEELSNYINPGVIEGGLKPLLLDYEESSFEVLLEKDGVEFFVSRSGGVLFENGVLTDDSPRVGFPYYIYQKYKKETSGYGLSQNLNFFDPTDSNSILYRNVTISYEFEDYDTTLDWSEYKEVLKNIVISLERK